MTDILILYERSNTDELGIRYTAEQMGIPLDFIPFHKVAVGIVNGGFTYLSKGKCFKGRLDDSKVVLNRTQSKHRRIFASTLLEGYGKKVLNPLQVELFCQSKIWTMMQFWNNDVNIPNTVYIPCDVEEKRVDQGVQYNSESIKNLINKTLGDKVVLKSDKGTHGNGIYLTEDDETLLNSLQKVKPSIINPAGVIAQEFVNKWFYDLRIVVEKHKGGKVFCHKTAMARGGFKDFRTNTFLGNLVFRVDLPDKIIKEAVMCGEALGVDQDAYVIALDAMPSFSESFTEKQGWIMPSFNALEEHFLEVVAAKKTPLNDFSYYTEQVESAYDGYMSSEPYKVIQSALNDSLEKADSILFHEANACPDFWEQTRIVGGVNVASSLLSCAQSILDK